MFLDEKLLGATSNAVERGNRRYRKMQKTVYRVRTRRAIEARLALDLLRERQPQGRAETTKTLHKAQGGMSGPYRCYSVEKSGKNPACSTTIVRL